MYTINDLRKQQYENHSRLYPYLDDWKKNPYTFLKARFYMESSAVLVYILLKTKVKPNTVSIIYGLLGIVTGILLSIPNNIAIFIGLVIAFNKGILDWSDGHYARITRQTSLTGHILDIYGAHLNSLGFQIGLGMYVAGKTDMLLFYYLIPLFIFFRAGSLNIFSKALLFDEISSENNVLLFLNNEKNKNLEVNGSESLDRKYINIFRGFLDDRARSVDFICLIILLEIFTPINISWIIFLLIVMKYFIIFAASFYIIGKGSWAEGEMTNKLKILQVLLRKKR